MAKPAKTNRPAPPRSRASSQGREPTPTSSASRPRWLLPAAIVGLVVVLLVVAVVITRLGGDGGGQDAELAQTRPVTVNGAPLPVLTKDAGDPAVGTTAPEVRGASFDGQPVEIGRTGRPTMVFFVAHWCPHCRREVPLLAPELGRITPPGVEVVTVATATRANDPNYPPSKWLREEGWPTKVLADDAQGSAARAYGLSGYPYYVLLDGGGKVVARGSGEKPVAEVEALLKQVASGARS